MGIMSFHQSRATRSFALITLVAFISGCLPQNLKTSTDSLLEGSKSITNFAGSLTDQIIDIADDIDDATGLDLIDGDGAMANREWTAEDQLESLEAQAAFRNVPLDSLPVYNPLKPGEAQKYSQKLAELGKKYKGRTTLNEAELLELAEYVVPVARYLAKARAYQNSKKLASDMRRSKNGQASVIVPAGMTLEVALLTYCNDHGLPAPWSGEKLQMRSSEPYMATALRPLYKDLHAYAATNSSAHYKMQSLVWWLRGNSCDLDRLTDDQVSLINTARSGGMFELQAYCQKQKVTKKLKGESLSFLGNSGFADQFDGYREFISQANDYQSKAQVFLNADLENPAQLLKLAQTSGLTANLGSKSILSNPNFSKYAPILKEAGFAKALIPVSDNDKVVSTSLSIMEELGRQIGAEQGPLNGSTANFTKLDTNLWVETTTNGGASNANVKFKNTGLEDVEVVGSDYVLTSVNDTNAGQTNYRPTQRLSIGPMKPVAVGPNEPDAEKLYSEKNQNEAKKTLEQLKDVEATFEIEPDKKEEEKCEQVAATKPNALQVEHPISYGLIADVLSVAPVVGNIIAGYSAITGKSFSDGSTLSSLDRALAFVTAVVPFGSAVKGLTSLGKAGLKAGYSNGTRIANVQTGLAKSAEAAYMITGNDTCKALSTASASGMSLYCARGSTSNAACMAAAGAASLTKLLDADANNTVLSTRELFSGGSSSFKMPSLGGIKGFFGL